MSPSAVATLSLVLLVLAVYWLPSIIASVRQHPDLVKVVVVNALLGWTVVGWLFAFGRAVSSAGRASAVTPGARYERRLGNVRTRTGTSQRPVNNSVAGQSATVTRS